MSTRKKGTSSRADTQTNNSKEGVAPAALESLLDDALLGFDDIESHCNAEENRNEVRVGTGSAASTANSGRGLGSNLKFDPLRGSRQRKKHRKVDSTRNDFDGLERLLQGLSVGSEEEGSMRDTLAALAATGPDSEAIDGDEDDDPVSSALVDSIMRQLLSKDVLYEPMKEIGEQYPPWLCENKDALEHDEYERYERQYGYIQKICSMYENEPDNYSGLMSLLQEMQQCGQPPQDIIDKVGPQGDSAALSGAFGSPGAPADCPVM